MFFKKCHYYEELFVTYIVKKRLPIRGLATQNLGVGLRGFKISNILEILEILRDSEKFYEDSTRF